jgi:ribosome-associated protein
LFRRRSKCTFASITCTAPEQADLSNGAITINGLQTARAARNILLDKKANEVVILDVRELSGITDYYVITSGSSVPHIKALAQETQRQLKTGGATCYRTSGAPDSEWVVLDFVDAVIHIFSPRTRAYYALEQLWSDAGRV